MAEDRMIALVCPDCEWQSKPTSPARAEYALRRHSCDKHRATLAARARGEAARARIDRAPKPCLHLKANHQHGTNACYRLDRCRCAPCSRAAVAYDRQRSRNTAYGRWHPFVDAQPIREHVAQLRADGLGLKLIAKHSGVAHGALWKLMYGKTRADGTYRVSETVRTETATALLALTADLDLLGQTVNVDGLGTRRRLQALVAAGWSQKKLAERLGMEPGNFGRTIGGPGRVQARTARAVRALYATLATQPPPEATHRDKIAASRARNLANARDWKPAMWWDDDELDGGLPSAPVPTPVIDEPDDVAILRAVEGDLSVTLTRAEREEVIRRLHARGMSDRTIANWMGIADRTVLRIRQDLGIPGVRRGAA
jgi:hypothetical protein